MLERDKNIITGSCSIQDHKVIVDNQVVFEDDSECSLPEFLKKVFKQFKIGYPKFYKMDPLTKLGFITA